MRAALAARGPFRRLASRFADRLAHLTERSPPLSRVLRGAGLAMAIRVVGVALALLTQVALARWMGQFEYGVFLFAWSWVFLLALVGTLGLDRAAVRFIPEYVGSERPGHVAGVVRSFRWLVVAGGLGLAACWCLGVLLLADRIPAYYVAPLCAASLSIPFFAQLNLHAEMSRAFAWVGQAYAPSNILRPVLLIAFVAALVALGWPRTGTDVMIAAALATGVCALVHAGLFQARVPAEVRHAAPVYRTRDWLRIALPMFLSGGAVLILLHTDLLLLGVLATPNDVAIYGAATRIAYVNALVFFAMSVVSVPQFSDLLARGRTDELQTLLHSVIGWTFWPSLLLVAGLLLLGRPILELFGPQFATGYPVLAILVLASLFRAITGPLAELLAVSGNQDVAAVALWSGAFANVVLNLLLIPAYGPLGAAVATSLAWVSIRVCFVVLVWRRLGVVPFLVGRR